jgi:hypothetical protein
MHSPPLSFLLLLLLLLLLQPASPDNHTPSTAATWCAGSA